jgi:hypothetical protein
MIALLLAAGAVLARVWLRPANVAPLVATQPAVVLRPLDVLVQLGLMLVCALGIRAILPGDDEQEDSADGADH